jgi:soluble lytic murein transglycosylase
VIETKDNAPMAAKQFLAVGLVLSVAGLVLLRPETRPEFAGLAKAPAQILTEKAAPKVDRIVTASILPLPTGNATALAQALNALSDDDYANARNLRDSLPKSSLEFKTLSWAMAYFAGMHLPSSDIAQASKIAGNWPGADVLLLNKERALSKENLTPVQIVAAFADKPPQSFEGALLLAQAYKLQGNMPAAIVAITPFWLTDVVAPGDEKLVLDEFGAMIPTSVHQGRMQKMLYETRVASAGRIAELSGTL